MASVFASGPTAAPRWYGRFKNHDGKWVSRRVRQHTRRDALRVAQALEAKAERVRVGLEAPEAAGQLCGALMRKWGAGLTNRSRETDLCRVDLHVLPHWRNVRVADVGLPQIMAWLDRMRDAGKIGPASQRHCLSLFSRWLNWCVERGHASRNPCRDIPPGRRPRAIPPRPESVPWIKTDGEALAIMRALGSPWAQMFYLGNRSGLRLGEICGLRVGDLDELAAGTICVAHSYLGPLKEDRHDTGKTKWVPAPSDAASVLGPFIARRRAAGAGSDDLVFVDERGDLFDRHAVAYRWRAVRVALGLPGNMTWYQATRHSFASRASAAGASIDEISGALGHSSPVITQAHYMHFTRKRWSPAMHAGLGLDADGQGAKVLSLSLPAAPVENVDESSVPIKPGKAGHAA